MDVSTYHLRFRAPLHVGERGVGQEAAHVHVPADTLFGALCMMWRDLYGVEELEETLLPAFQTGAPFRITSAFPYAGGVRFFPRPLVRLPVEDPKALRRVRFVSESVFAAILRGETPPFHPAVCANQGTLWLSRDERAALAGWTDDATGDLALWRETIASRVTLDRLTSRSELWRFGRVLFAEGCGLWFAAHCDAAWRNRFEAALRLLGDSGLGGERGAGHGLFTLAASPAPPAALTVDVDSSSASFVTLAPCCPRDAAEAAALTSGDPVAYDLLPRRGWIGSPEAGGLRRQTVWMFAEGSVLAGAGNAGRLAPVTPDAAPHAVLRYGLAFPLRLAEPQPAESKPDRNLREEQEASVAQAPASDAPDVETEPAIEAEIEPAIEAEIEPAIEAEIEEGK
jgi:CRISPR-associated protein Csm4